MKDKVLVNIAGFKITRVDKLSPEGKKIYMLYREPGDVYTEDDEVLTAQDMQVTMRKGKDDRMQVRVYMNEKRAKRFAEYYQAKIKEINL